MKNFYKILFYTILDQMRNKSFYVLLGISVFFVFLLRGCYKADFSVNGEQVNNITLAWYASRIAFHLVANGMILMAALLAMSIFSRDESNGSLVLFLSRPVSRGQYVLGRVGGTWLLATVFMLILHFTIFLIAWIKTGGIIPGYLTASLICSLNLLFIILLVALMTLFLPDFIAAMMALAVAAVSFLSDGVFLFMQNKMVQSAFSENMFAEPTLWRILFPKISLLQHYAVIYITHDDFQGMGPVHPLLNLCGYILLISVLLLFNFNRREI